MAVGLKEGAMVHGHRIIAHISSGGEGDVYKALAPDGSECALKQHNFSASDPEYKVERDRVLRRRGLIGKRHPNVAQTLNILEDRDLLYEVVEFVQGKSLLDVIGAKGRLSLEEARRLSLCVLDGLDWLHGISIIHRDIKPANIIVMPDGQAKLIDLGIMLSLGSTRLTRRGAPCTVEYAPLEVIRGGSDRVDQRSDLYSFGITLYEALAGVFPFPLRPAEAHIQAKARGDFTPLRSSAPGVPAALEECIKRLLQPLPDARYASAAEARNALEKAFGGDKPKGCAKPIAVTPVCESKGVRKETSVRALEGVREDARPRGYAEHSMSKPIRETEGARKEASVWVVDIGGAGASYPSPVTPSTLEPVCEDDDVCEATPVRMPDAFKADVKPGDRITSGAVKPVYEDGGARRETSVLVQVLGGPTMGSWIEVPTIGTCVGRLEINPEDLKMTRSHARFTPTKKGIRVNALGALNGILVDGKRVRQANISYGQEFVMGTTPLRCEKNGGK